MDGCKLRAEGHAHKSVMDLAPGCCQPSCGDRALLPTEKKSQPSSLGCAEHNRVCVTGRNCAS